MTYCYLFFLCIYKGRPIAFTGSIMIKAKNETVQYTGGVWDLEQSTSNP